MHQIIRRHSRARGLMAGIAVLFFLLNLQPLFSQTGANEAFDPKKTYGVDLLQEDFRIFRLALEEGHAGLYRYTPKKELDGQFVAIEKSLTRPLTEIEFFRLLAPLIGNINDGHTRINFSAALENNLQDQPVLFPFKLQFIDDKAYLFRNYSENEGLMMGSELLSINKKPIAEVIDLMLPLVTRDAHVETARLRRMESTVLFGSLYTALFGPTASFSIGYREPGSGDVKTVAVKGIPSKDLNGVFARRYPDAARQLPPIQVEWKEDIAVLTVRTFGSGAYQSAKISYPTFLRDTFKEFEDKGTQHIVIDLRDNGGGDDAYGKILFAHLMDKPFQYYRHLRINRAEYSFFKYTNVPPEQTKLPANQFKKNDEGTYDLTFHPNLGLQQPIPPIFQGKVYVLINGNSFSGTGECTSLIHYHKKAVFIGEECGSGYYGNTSGFMPELTLPNTKLRVRIPLLLYTMAVSGYPEDRGIIPDHPVAPSIKDLLEGMDRVMEYTIELIKKEKGA
jgi:hypothetical protein